MGVHYDASWTNNRVHFVSPARGNNAARGGEGYSRRGTERERERERGGGAASPQTYITTRGILSLSPTLAILSPPRCSFVDFSSDREKRKIVGRWKRERERESWTGGFENRGKKRGEERGAAWMKEKNWLWKVERNGWTIYLLIGVDEEWKIGKWWNGRDRWVSKLSLQ